MEKVINEFKVIETDDGFRIEIKGDKEAMRKLFSHVGAHRHLGRGPFGRGFPFGPGFWGGFSGWCNPCEEPEEKKGA